MLVVYICAALYKISTGTLASRCPSATAGLLVKILTSAVFAFELGIVGLNTRFCVPERLSVALRHKLECG